MVAALEVCCEELTHKSYARSALLRASLGWLMAICACAARLVSALFAAIYLLGPLSHATPTEADGGTAYLGKNTPSCSPSSTQYWPGNR